MSFRFLAVALSGALLWAPVLAQAGVRVALLPISVHAADSNTEYLRTGLGEMLSARLERYPELEVVRLGSEGAPPTEASAAVAAASSAGADFVVFGSFTRFGEGASLDLRCAEVARASGEDDARPGSRRIFIHSGTLAEIIPQLDTLAEKLARYALGGGRPGGVAAKAQAAEGAAGDGSGGPKAAEFEDLMRRVDALERAVYAPTAAEARPADESDEVQSSGSLVR